MEKIINYNYNVEIKNGRELKTHYQFEHNNEFFFFVPYNRTIEDLHEIMEVSSELKKKKITTHDIILNKDKLPVTKVNESNYILLRVIGNPYDKYDVFDIIDMNNALLLGKIKSKLYRNDWANLWSNKVDYFEYQVRELGKSKRIVIESFSYYVGLAENAISYVTKTMSELSATEFDRISLCRKRLYFPNYKLSYLNPLNFIFDLEVRDIAEYIKNMFFNNEDAFKELNVYLKSRKLSKFGYQMLYSRLLYPSYYFDIFELVMEKEVEEEQLIKIIDKAEEYELFLKNTYFEILKYSEIEQIEWIIKNKD